MNAIKIRDSNVLLQVTMPGESNLVRNPETVVIKIRNRTQCIPFAVVSKAAEISQLL